MSNGVGGTDGIPCMRPKGWGGGGRGEGAGAGSCWSHSDSWGGGIKGPVLAVANGLAGRKAAGGEADTRGKLSLKIPSQAVDRLLERESYYLKDLQERSGTTIGVSREGHHNLCDVDIIGTEREREVARKFIQDFAKLPVGHLRSD